PGSRRPEQVWSGQHQRVADDWLLDHREGRRPMIACILLPYFAVTLARREQRLPEGVPLILRSGEKVAACCESAGGRGVGIGMPISSAKWRCREAEVIPINYQTIRQHMNDIVQMLSQFTHLIEIEHLPAKLRPRTNPFPDARQSAVFYVDLE